MQHLLLNKIPKKLKDDGVIKRISYKKCLKL